MNESVPPFQSRPPDRTLEVLCHLLGLAGLTGIPLGNVIAPLCLWLWKREVNPAVNAHGRESVNFQISMSIYLLLAGLTFMIGIGIVLLPLVILVQVICTILAAVKANKGELYRYPITIRFLN
jgi:uncharacterized Tic20 family protein